MTPVSPDWTDGARFDVIIVGGGAAGLSAALLLGRARRKTLLADAGLPRNSRSPASHGVFTRDGASPEELLRHGRLQVARYADVTLANTAAVTAVREAASFRVTFDNGKSALARRLLLAAGVRDELPSIDGLAGLWGTSVLHCPFCHGWEVRDQPLAVYARDESVLPMVKLLRRLSSDLLVCSDGRGTLSPDSRRLLATRGVRLRDEPLRRMEGVPAGIRLHFADGPTEDRRAFFLRPTYHLRSDLPHQLGCALTPEALIKIDRDGRSSVPGIFAAGDAAQPQHQVLYAAASGACAAMGLARDLADEDFYQAPASRGSAPNVTTDALPPR
jgi:thioredoxin reductase